jgi:hypothetical protein
MKDATASPNPPKLSELLPDYTASKTKRQKYLKTVFALKSAMFAKCDRVILRHHGI